MAEAPPLDVPAIAVAMAEADPVFVVGPNRSGTSVLRRTLERHPAFRAPGARSPETRVFAKPERVFKILRPQGRPLLRYLRDDEAAARALLDALGPRERWRGGVADEVVWLRAYFHVAARVRGARRLLEKTPSHVLHLDRVFAAFPRARVIATLRHPVDVLSSLRKRRRGREEAGRAPATGGWQHFTAADLADAWGRIAGIAQEQAHARPEAVRLVRYEDLTADPEGVLRGLCAFLGEPWEPEALLGEVAVARDAHGSPSNRGRIAANAKRWEAFLSETEARELEDALEQPMRALGYGRYT